MKNWAWELYIFSNNTIFHKKTPLVVSFQNLQVSARGLGLIDCRGQLQWDYSKGLLRLGDPKWSLKESAQFAIFRDHFTVKQATCTNYAFQLVFVNEDGYTSSIEPSDRNLWIQYARNGDQEFLKWEAGLLLIVEAEIDTSLRINVLNKLY